MIQQHIEDLKKIFVLHKVERADIFGSALTADFYEDSDIDILVTFKDNIALLDYADNYFDLKEKLEDIFNRKVDLVSSRSIKNPVLIESINKSKKPLYVA